MTDPKRPWGTRIRRGRQAQPPAHAEGATTWGSHYGDADAELPRDLAYYLSVDSAPPGYAVRRPWWLGCAFLMALAAATLVVAAELRPLERTYVDVVSGLSGATRERLLRSSGTLSLRPFVFVLVGLLGAFAPGTALRRLRFAVTGWVVYAGAAVVADALLADSVGVGSPNPFTPRGGVVSVVVALLVFVWLVFAGYELPADERVSAERRRSRRPLLVAGGVVLVSVALVVVTAPWRHHLFQTVHVPLVNGFASTVVLLILTVQVLLFAAGALQRPRARALDQPVDVGVIVPAYNEEYSISAVIAALDAAADAYSGRVALYLVNNDSIDRTAAEAAAALGQCVALTGRIIDCPTRGKSHALNMGLGATTEPVVVRVDADTIVEPTLFTRVVPYLQDPGVGGVSGLPLPREDAPRWIYAVRLMEVLYSVAFLRVGQSSVDATLVMPGNMSAYRGDVVRRLGFGIGFNGEDTDMAVRLGRTGLRIVTDLNVRFYPEVPATIGQLREQRQRWTRGILCVAARNGSGIAMGQGLRCLWMLPWSTVNACRRALMIPVFLIAVLLALTHPAVVTLREVAVIGGIIVGVHIAIVVVMLVAYRRFRYLPFVPLYLMFRAFKLYVAMEALLTLEVRRHRAPAPVPVPSELEAPA